MLSVFWKMRFKKWDIKSSLGQDSADPQRPFRRDRSPWWWPDPAPKLDIKPGFKANTALDSSTMSVLREPVAPQMPGLFCLWLSFVPRLSDCMARIFPGIADLRHTTPIKACISWDHIGLQPYWVLSGCCPETAPLRSSKLWKSIYGEIHLSSSLALRALP